MDEVQVNCLGDLSLPRKSVSKLTDCTDMTIAAYHGHKITTQQQQQINLHKINMNQFRRICSDIFGFFFFFHRKYCKCTNIWGVLMFVFFAVIMKVLTKFRQS